MMLARFGQIGLGALAVFVTGCALEVAPSPPTLHIPERVQDLTAVRAGDAVTLQWKMPRETTDKVPLKGNQRVEICRSVGTQPCKTAASLAVPPAKPQTYTDHLPAALDSGAPQLLTYHLELFSPAHRTAGVSNAAVVVAGSPPPAVGPVTLTTRKDGIVMHWQPKAPARGLLMRIRRALVVEKNAPKPKGAEGAPPPTEQVLEINLDQADPGQGIDRDAPLDHRYTYTLQRVLQVKLAGQTSELPGDTSPPVTVDAKNTFAPAAPREVQAVADEQAHAIDLSWEPVPEPGVAGYLVYRRPAEQTQQGTWTRISPSQPLTAPAYRDETAVPGTPYAYAVRAIDQDGNQSPLSAETQEELPAPQPQ